MVTASLLLMLMGKDVGVGFRAAGGGDDVEAFGAAEGVGSCVGAVVVVIGVFAEGF